ncbi:MAG TPA: glycosyltransferase family 4 protein [Thermodesulfobacteriota bacterium]|nr:glycosyltransferase family 4 protein [Thermodesulfobacteriota bacterium]
MKKIRFAIGLRDFSKKKGGAERYLVDLCTRMASEGHEVHVYTEHHDEEDSRIFFHPVKTIRFPRSVRLLSFAIRATREIEKGDYDIIFGVGNTLKADVLQPHGGVHWAWFWRSLRVYENPILWMVKLLGRIFSLKQWVSGWVEDAPYRAERLRAIIAISDMVKQDMMRWHRVPEERIHVVYNGVDLERFHPRNRRYRQEIRKRHEIGDEFVLLFVSNNFRMKGLVSLIKALAETKKANFPPFRLLVLGRDRQESYSGLARAMGIFEEVIFAGSSQEPEKYYGASDILVHPTFYDACSLTVLEALASGLPVITTASNGASGVLSHGEEGWVIDDLKDEDELRRGIAYFLDEKRRREASYRARRKAELYSEKANFDRVMTIFNEALVR